jgi:Trypsin
MIDGLTLVRLGSYNISSSNEGAIDVNVEWRSTHENYDPKYIANDIAMLRLASVVPITNLIRPICIPMTEALINRDYTGQLPYVVSCWLRQTRLDIS